jgi:hypothetical protein
LLAPLRFFFFLSRPREIKNPGDQRTGRHVTSYDLVGAGDGVGVDVPLALLGLGHGEGARFWEVEEGGGGERNPRGDDDEMGGELGEVAAFRSGRRKGKSALVQWKGEVNTSVQGNGEPVACWGISIPGR